MTQKPVTLDSTPEEIRAAWIAALRSGEYTQARMVLFNGKGYCCLGVLCSVVGLVPEKNENRALYQYTFEGQIGTLPQIVQEAVRLRTSDGTYKAGNANLTSMNDSGASFEKIADLLENPPEGLFR